MNISPDYIIERRRNKKQLVIWKLLVLGLVILLLFVGRGSNLPSAENITQSKIAQKEHIASVRIEEIIFDDLDRVKRLAEIGKDKNIKALIVNINSPGGSVVGSEMLYNSLLKISKSKPVVIVMDSLAASGGYLAALGGDYIIAHNGTLTGSIGIIMQSAEVTELAEKLGIKFDTFKSDPLKASPNPMEKTTPEAREAVMSSVNQVHDYFMQQVAIRRKLDIELVRKLANGMVYSGRQALDLKLVDAIGDQDTALEWLYKEKGISKDLEVIDTKLKLKEKLIDLIMEDFQSKISSLFYSKMAGFKSVI